MPHPLDGCYSKLDRAESQLDALEQETRDFKRSDPYELVRDLDRESGDIILRVYGSTPPHWPIVVGEVVHNLRSALDHLVWELAVLNGKKPPRQSGFPIYKSPDLYWSPCGHGALAKIGRLGDKERAIIEGLQPYHRFKPASHELAMLHGLSNEDKHRGILVTGSVGVGSTVIIDPGSGQPTSMRLYAVRLKDGAIVARVPAVDGIEPNVDMDFKLDIVITLEQVGEFSDQPMVDTLREVLGFVRENVFGALAPSFPER